MPKSLGCPRPAARGLLPDCQAGTASHTHTRQSIAPKDSEPGPETRHGCITLGNPVTLTVTTHPFDVPRVPVVALANDLATRFFFAMLKFRVQSPSNVSS